MQQPIPPLNVDNLRQVRTYSPLVHVGPWRLVIGNKIHDDLHVETQLFIQRRSERTQFWENESKYPYDRLQELVDEFNRVTKDYRQPNTQHNETDSPKPQTGASDPAGSSNDTDHR